jgi:hypothetical protein
MMMKEQEQTTTCSICNAPCILIPIERVGKGIRIKAIHEDGSTHTWLRYSRLEDVGETYRKKVKVTPL